MKDQVKHLSEKGVTAIHMQDTFDSMSENIKSNLMNGTYSVIFTSPELLLGDKSWIDVFQSPTLSETLVALVIDEAHCIIKWYSFIMVIYVFNLGRSFKGPPRLSTWA